MAAAAAERAQECSEQQLLRESGAVSWSAWPAVEAAANSKGSLEQHEQMVTACQPAAALYRGGQQQHHTGMDSKLRQLAKAGGTNSGMQLPGALPFTYTSTAAAFAVLPVTCLSLAHQCTAPATFPLPPSSHYQCHNLTHTRGLSWVCFASCTPLHNALTHTPAHTLTPPQVRTQTLVKNAIIQIDAAPFKQWYQQHYGIELGQKKGTTEEATETKVCVCGVVVCVGRGEYGCGGPPGGGWGSGVGGVGRGSMCAWSAQQER